ncbi:MAG: outer membrane protein [Limisphaerales bacterium]|jgi:outer membrane protein
MSSHNWSALLIFLLINISVSFGQATSSDTTSLSLKEALQYGIENSVVMREGRNTVLYAEQRAKNAVSRGWPQVDANIGYNDNLALPTFLIPIANGETQEAQFGTQHNAVVGASISQLVFDGAYFLGVKAAKKLVNLESERTRLSQIDLKHNITQSYYTCLIAELRVNAFVRAQVSVSKIAVEARAYYESGFAEELDADRLDLSVSDLTTAINNANRDLETAQNMLKYYMGMEFSSNFKLTDQIDMLLLQESLVAEQFEPGNRQEFRIVQLQKETNELNVKYMRSSFLPKLYLYGSYEQQAQRDQFDFFDFDQNWFEVATVGLNLEIPIFDGFSRRSNVEMAKIQLDNLSLTEENLKLQLGLQAAQSKTGYLNAIDRLSSLRKSRDLSEKIFNVTQIKYREGVGSSLELTTAQQEYEQAEDEYIAAMYDLLIARSDLRKALGKYQTEDPR